jgi:AraC-like DNA-binding protein
VSGLDAHRVPVGVFESNDEIRKSFFTIRDLLKSKEIYKQDLFDLHAGLLITAVKSVTTTKKDEAKGEQRIDKVKEIIDTRFQENISLDDIAAQLYMSKPYLRLLFKKKFGTSPLYYLITKRVDKAKYLLNYTGIPVKEVAANCGFDNPYYFSKMFKQETGFTPSEYRLECNKGK